MERAKEPASVWFSSSIAYALGLWLGILVTVGGIAAYAFPTMKQLDPSLPAYSAYPKDHWAIAAGHIMNPVFSIAAKATAMLGFLTLVAHAGVFLPENRPLTRRTKVISCVLGLAFLMAVACLLVTARMSPMVEEYWRSASLGNVADADAAKLKFDGLHKIANALFIAQFVALMIAIPLTGMSAKRVSKDAAK